MKKNSNKVIGFAVADNMNTIEKLKEINKITIRKMIRREEITEFEKYLLLIDLDELRPGANPILEKGEKE